VWYINIYRVLLVIFIFFGAKLVLVCDRDLFVAFFDFTWIAVFSVFNDETDFCIIVDLVFIILYF